ncbi:hypothetical protein ABWJ92_37570 [Streptomyces sp. NPDC000609]|uniref:hypothetical protein n=1 Tax=Streptomyces sp. NPDC000609 TaxID=3160957 RepID=UPI00339678C2
MRYSTIRLLAMVTTVTGIPRLLANDPGNTVASGLAGMCTILDHADRPYTARTRRPVVGRWP